MGSGKNKVVTQHPAYMIVVVASCIFGSIVEFLAVRELPVCDNYTKFVIISPRMNLKCLALRGICVAGVLVGDATAADFPVPAAEMDVCGVRERTGLRNTVNTRHRDGASITCTP